MPKSILRSKNRSTPFVGLPSREPVREDPPNRGGNQRHAGGTAQKGTVQGLYMPDGFYRKL